MLNIKNDCNFIIPDDRNSSLSRNTSELLLLISKLNLPIEISLDFKQRLLKASSEPSVGILESLDDEYIRIITHHYIPKIQQLSNVYGKQIFINNYPDCYLQPRFIFNNLSISLEQLKIIQNAIDYARELYSKNINSVQEV